MFFHCHLASQIVVSRLEWPCQCPSRPFQFTPGHKGEEYILCLSPIVSNQAKVSGWSFITLTRGHDHCHEKCWNIKKNHKRKWVKLVLYVLKEWVSKISLLQRILHRGLCVHSQYPLSCYQCCQLLRTSLSHGSVSKIARLNVGGKANHKHYIAYFPLIFSDIYILPGFCVGRALGCYLNNISAPLPLHHTVHVASDLIHWKCHWK